MKNDTEADSNQIPVRMTRNYRRLQSAVNKYLNDGGAWIDNVAGVMDELARISRDLERREEEIAARQAKLDQREADLDSLFECVLSELKSKQQS